MISTPNTAWKSYVANFRRDAHQLLYLGFQRGQSKIQELEKEDNITGFVAEEIEAVLSDPSTEERLKRFYSCHEQPPLRDPSGRKKGARRSRADIRIRFSGVTPPIRYLFEAKRLHNKRNRIDKYLGEGGLHQLLTDEGYIDNIIEAAMVGYMQSGSASYWKAEITGSLSNVKYAHLLTVAGLASDVIIPEMPDTCVSKHENINKTHVNIYHLFFDCMV